MASKMRDTRPRKGIPSTPAGRARIAGGAGGDRREVKPCRYGQHRPPAVPRNGGQADSCIVCGQFYFSGEAEAVAEVIRRARFALRGW